MRNNDELRLLAHVPHHVGKAVDVGLIQRGVDFIENAEGAGLETKHCDQQRKGSERFLAAGQQKDILKLLTGRLGNDFDSGVGFTGFFQKTQLSVSATEQVNEGCAESCVDSL